MSDVQTAIGLLSDYARELDQLSRDLAGLERSMEPVQIVPGLEEAMWAIRRDAREYARDAEEFMDCFEAWEDRLCVACKGPLAGRQKKYCSDECRKAKRHRRWAQHKTNECPKCGSLITPRARTCKRCARKGLTGPTHPAWSHDTTSRSTGHARARRIFELDGCEFAGCEKPAVDRHHIDGNPLNNDLSNLQGLCRLHHMVLDGRLAASQARLHGR